jgi:membrane protease YdiL (CAAX protease family)
MGSAGNRINESHRVSHLLGRINRRQSIAIFAPPLLAVAMIPVFRLFSGLFEQAVVGWYLGLVAYWVTWCTMLPLWLVGRKRLVQIIRPRRPTVTAAALVLFPAAMAALGRRLIGMGYAKPEAWVWLLYLSTAFGNGFFEELLWRGLYMELFPDRNFMRIVWPSIWFSLWHYAPGSVSANSNPLALMIGAGLFGFLLAFLAKKTGTIGWCVLAHVLGGIVMIL